MPSLRQRLQLESAELYAAFLRSWEIAGKEWLPAVPPSEGSYNSLPHFTNVEHHLEALLGAAAESPATTLRLSTLEIYLLLASVLFHDFGRVYVDAEHAAASARKLPEHFTALGIPTVEIASSLARIALYHDPLAARDKSDDESRNRKKMRTRKALRDVRFDPFGTARELYVATLLALADHMDGSVQRAVPRYVMPDDEVGFKGAFRRLVSGTGYDPATCTLKTCLNGFEEASDEKPGSFDFKNLYCNFIRWDRNTPAMANRAPVYAEIPAKERAPADRSCPLYDQMIRTCCPDLSMAKPSKMFHLCLASSKTKTEKSYAIKRKETSVVGTNEKLPKRGAWPADYLLAVALNDLRVNRRFLIEEIKDDLYEMGLPVDDWFVEFDSEVYDESGQLVSEPTLPVELLERVAREMWQLCLRLLGGGLMSYEVLADSLRMENVALVRLAVGRIKQRASAKFTSAQSAKVISASASGWRWVVPENGLDEQSGLDFVLKALHLEAK